MKKEIFLRIPEGGHRLINWLFTECGQGFEIQITVLQIQVVVSVGPKLGTSGT